MASLAVGGAAAAMTMVTVVPGVAAGSRNAAPTKIAASGAAFGSSAAAAKTTTRLALRRGVTYVNGSSASSSNRTQRASGALAPIRAVAMQDSLTDEESEGIGEIASGQRELKDYPPGLQRYETMAVLRPDISEEQRLALTQRYEEVIISGGGLDVEIFNRGMQPLAYNIKTKNMSGVSSRYLDGIYLLFTYVTKPESQLALQKRLNADDDIIRSTTFRLKAL